MLGSTELPTAWGSHETPVGPTGAWDPPLEVCSLESVWLLRVALGSVIEISRGQVINYVFNNVFEKPPKISTGVNNAIEITVNGLATSS